MKSVAAVLTASFLLVGCANSEPDWDLAVKPLFVFQTLKAAQGWQQGTPALATCTPSRSGHQHICQLRDNQVAGAKTEATEALFDDEGLRALHVAWPLQDYAAVAGELTAAYGTPCSQATTNVRGPQYSTLSNVVTIWCFREGAMTLEKYAGNRDTVRLTYSSERASLVPSENRLQIL
ncbi:hypothetical protein ABI_45790 [Asticcacaulis biprosthecium C19]|uniref:Lipoprotein n=1 Tax=Asticcacaulis biprosthecium C19 TaxID=715226 RepID=F4QTT2_9CAUL|nr:hypothetical protein [Asticcacaulis biprosthecium]EGF89232.1 hypothetical protein ABI_45790 [Asticcacaulis biprosthecium C19]